MVVGEFLAAGLSTVSCGVGGEGSLRVRGKAVGGSSAFGEGSEGSGEYERTSMVQLLAGSDRIGARIAGFSNKSSSSSSKYERDDRRLPMLFFFLVSLQVEGRKKKVRVVSGKGGYIKDEVSMTQRDEV